MTRSERKRKRTEDEEISLDRRLRIKDDELSGLENLYGLSLNGRLIAAAKREVKGKVWEGSVSFLTGRGSKVRTAAVQEMA